MTDPFQNGVYFLMEEFAPTGAFSLELTPPLKKEKGSKNKEDLLQGQDSSPDSALPIT